MLQNNNGSSILQLFFREPNREWYIRHIVREIGLGAPSVVHYLKQFLDAQLITRQKGPLYPYYTANTQSSRFKRKKQRATVDLLHESGCVRYIARRCQPDCIILFGSASLGEDSESSDIDLFVQANEKSLNLQHYEKKMNRKISVFFTSNFIKLGKELRNNIINGIPLDGYLVAFR